MKIRNSWYFGLVFFVAVQVQAQNPVIDAIIKEATQNSKLEVLAHEIMDGVGPRLVGSPQMQKAHDLAVTTYQSWASLPVTKSGANGEAGKGGSPT